MSAEKRKPGRPRLYKETTSLTVRLDATLKASLEKEAEAEGQKLSQLVIRKLSGKK